MSRLEHNSDCLRGVQFIAVEGSKSHLALGCCTCGAEDDRDMVTRYQSKTSRRADYFMSVFPSEQAARQAAIRSCSFGETVEDVRPVKVKVWA